MAIKISNSTIIDDSRNVGVVGILTATTFNVGTGGTVITANTSTGGVGIGTTVLSSLPTVKLDVNGHLAVRGGVNSNSYYVPFFSTSTAGAAISYSNYSPSNGIWSSHVGWSNTGSRQIYQISWLNSATVYAYIYLPFTIAGSAAYAFRAQISGLSQNLSSGAVTQFCAGNYNGAFTSNESAVLTLRTSTSDGYTTMTPSGSAVHPDFTVISNSPVLRLPRGTASSTTNKTFYSLMLEWTVMDSLF